MPPRTHSGTGGADFDHRPRGSELRRAGFEHEACSFTRGLADDARPGYSRGSDGETTGKSEQFSPKASISIYAHYTIDSPDRFFLSDRGQTVTYRSRPSPPVRFSPSPASRDHTTGPVADSCSGPIPVAIRTSSLDRSMRPSTRSRSVTLRAGRNRTACTAGRTGDHRSALRHDTGDIRPTLTCPRKARHAHRSSSPRESFLNSRVE